MGLFLLISIFSLLLRVAVSLHSYPGAGTLSKLGDFEAQSQWMEITTNSPIKILLLNGLFIKHLDPNSVSLLTSRGYEIHFGKLLMRWTVLSSDLLIFSPAVLCFILSDVVWHIPVILTNPCLILTDHDHFQYNCISLGLTLGAVAAVCFSFFSALFDLFINLKGPPVLSLLAPFERGIYEDYVANFWCSFLYGSLNNSLAFFHEKSILLPLLLPATLLAMELPGVLSILLMLSVLFSMYPLLCCDKLALPYMALYMLSILLCLAPCRKQHVKKHLSRSMITISIVISYLCSLVCSSYYILNPTPRELSFPFQCNDHEFLLLSFLTNAKQGMLSRDKEKKLI
ncbi:dolichyl pyrophosphate Man9GlcNAc2 alpha-1,3-glucosyltransferase [Salix suchowensis]|nr:dolichyl pyrophosphate Man9GlcNAc2 alpha-1,3-glucosyltransferase [Salix suchowensis]